MSINKYNPTTGELELLAGGGKAEYGASTVRSGYLNAENLTEPFSGVMVLDLEHQSVQYAITFSTPMPDNDYIVICDVHNTNLQVEVASADKTKNGFIVTVRNLVATMRADRGETTDGFTFELIDNYFNYTAFKLYTDTEYNNLLNNAVLTSDVTDSITNGDMNPVTSNAVAEALEVEDLTSQITMSNGTDGNPLFTRGSGINPWNIFSCIRYGKMIVFSVCYGTFSGKLTSGTICFSGLPKAIAPAECGGSFDTRWFIDIGGTVIKAYFSKSSTELENTATRFQLVYFIE